MLDEGIYLPKISKADNPSNPSFSCWFSIVTSTPSAMKLEYIPPCRQAQRHRERASGMNNSVPLHKGKAWSANRAKPLMLPITAEFLMPKADCIVFMERESNALYLLFVTPETLSPRNIQELAETIENPDNWGLWKDAKRNLYFLSNSRDSNWTKV